MHEPTYPLVIRSEQGREVMRNASPVGRYFASVVVLALLLVVVPARPAAASAWDVWPAGVDYCAETRPGHGTWSGFGPAVDMNAPGDSGMPLLAPTNGIVNVMTTSGSWGNSVHWVSADQGEKIHMAHLSAFGRTGVVEAGDLIGYIGSTGRSDSPHLHASAWRGGAATLVLSGTTVAAGGCYTSRGAATWRSPKTVHRATASLAVRRSWTRGHWEVRLSCTDDWSGCARTRYRVDDGGSVVYTGPFDVTDEGLHDVAYRSRDGSGHVERLRHAYVKIDRTKPKVSIRTPSTTASTGEVELRAKASDPFASDPAARSGLYRVTFVVCPSAGGECQRYGARLEDGLWRARATLPPGEYISTARAEDVAYNRRKSERLTFTVGAAG